MNHGVSAAIFLHCHPSQSVDILSADDLLPTPVLAEAGSRLWTASDLASGVRAGNEAAFTELHRQYSARLFRFALVMARGQEIVAAETVQNTFLRAIKHLHKAADDTALWAWLAKAARCAATDAARKASRYSAVISTFTRLWSASESHPPAEDTEAHWHQALEAAVAELSETDQAMLRARYHERNSLAEIAARHDTTDRAIESRLARLRAGLRAAILQRLSLLP